MADYDRDYWDKRYIEGDTPWDIGYAATPLKEYFDQLENKDMRILIPGCGNGYEAMYLMENGFTNVYVIDISQLVLNNLAKKIPAKYRSHLIAGDFFNHSEKYDLIVEQTFFCALDPALRKTYASKMADLLNDDGKLAGLLFDDKLNTEHPPYGGNREEYLPVFEPWFDIKVMETAYNSIKPRAGRELFMILQKKNG